MTNPEVRYFRFNPADYNSTPRIVKNCWPGKLFLELNGDVTLEYRYDSELLSLFFILATRNPTPDDTEPILSPREVRGRNIMAYLKLGMYSYAFILILIAVVVIIYRAIFSK
jgi:hypothetical protein